MKIIQLSAVILLLAGCSGQKDSVSIDASVTQLILDHHMQTFKQNDLEGVMDDYTDESVLITPDHVYTGLAEIRQNFVAAFQALPTNGTTLTLTKSVVSKDVAYIIWKATTPTLEFKFATDTFIIQNGKIVRQTYSGDVAPLPK